MLCYKGPFTNYVIGIGGGGVSQMIIYDYGGQVWSKYYRIRGGGEGGDKYKE